jgi:hypothetical protein
VRADQRPAARAEPDHALHRRRVAGVAAARDVEQVEQRPQLLGLVWILAGVEVEQRHPRSIAR